MNRTVAGNIGCWHVGRSSNDGPSNRVPSNRGPSNGGRRLGFAAQLPLLLLLLLPAGGCRICADCDDLAYPAYGGIWQRTNRDSGRVGSIFDPAGAKKSDLVSRETPVKPDETLRKNRSERDKIDEPSPSDEDVDSAGMPEEHDVSIIPDGVLPPVIQ